MNVTSCENMKGEANCDIVTSTPNAMEDMTEIPTTESPVVTIKLDSNGAINSLKDAYITHANPDMHEDVTTTERMVIGGEMIYLL